MADPYGSLSNPWQEEADKEAYKQALEKLKEKMTPPSTTQKVMQALGRVYTATTNWVGDHLDDVHLGGEIKGIGKASIEYKHENGKKTLEVGGQVSVKKAGSVDAGIKLHWDDAPAPAPP